MGEPGWGNAQAPLNESIVQLEGTRGSETSKYPEEKKENSISLVAASERERGQTEGPGSSGLRASRMHRERLVDARGKAPPERGTAP